MTNQRQCRKTDIPVEGNARCGGEYCEKCGWNPEINLARRRKIRRVAENGILHLWGIDLASTPKEILEQRRQLLAKVRRKLL